MSSPYSGNYRALQPTSSLRRPLQPTHYDPTPTLYQESESALAQLQYMQKLEQDLAAARRKVQECEATILRQAHTVRHSSSLRTQHGIICPDCNHEVLHACHISGPHSVHAGDPTGSNAQRSIFQHLWDSVLFRSPSRPSPPPEPTPLAIPRPSTQVLPTSLISTTTNDPLLCPKWSVEFTAGVDRRLEMQLVRTITDERGAFRVKYSPDGKLLAVIARMSHIVTVYSVATGARIYQLVDLYSKKDPPLTYDLGFSSNGKLLVTSTMTPEHIIRVWEIGKKRLRNSFKGHLDSIYAMDFSPDDRLLISASYDGTARIWNMRDGSSRIFFCTSSGISSVRFSPDRRHFIAGSLNGDIHVWQRRSGRRVALLKGHTSDVDSLAFMPNGRGFISGSWDRSLKYWDINTTRISDETRHGAPDNADQKEAFTYVGHTGRIRSISISPDSQWITSGANDCTVRIWNPRNGVQHCILRGHDAEVLSVEFSPAGNYLTTACRNGSVRIWNYEDPGAEH